MLPDIHPAMPLRMDFDKYILFHADKAGSAGGLRAMISAICVSCRDEVAKAIRRALGDNGGVKFRHGTYNFRGGWSNAIDTVLKDNLLIEVYAL